MRKPITLLLNLCLLAAAPAGAQQRYEYTEVHMGMPVRMVLYTGTDQLARDAARAAFARIAELDTQLSDHRGTSELRQIEARAGAWVTVSPSTVIVLQRALEIAHLTDGAFDPTVAPVIGLWRTARRSGQLPALAALDSARALVGYGHLQIDSARNTVLVEKSGMRLDLGGIAKGFILQEALGTLRRHGVDRAMLEAGGDIVVGAAPPGQSGWRIAVPGADSAFQARAHKLVNAALATSGPGAQFVEIDGIRYSHVIDPRTGRALTNGLTAHVIAPDGATADALATAITVLLPPLRANVVSRFSDVFVFTK